MAKEKQSIYLLIGKDDKVTKVIKRTEIPDAIEKMGEDKLKEIYRAIPMGFRKVTTVKLIAVGLSKEDKKRGSTNNA